MAKKVISVILGVWLGSGIVFGDLKVGNKLFKPVVKIIITPQPFPESFRSR